MLEQNFEAVSNSKEIEPPPRTNKFYSLESILDNNSNSISDLELSKSKQKEYSIVIPTMTNVLDTYKMYITSIVKNLVEANKITKKAWRGAFTTESTKRVSSNNNIVDNNFEESSVQLNEVSQINYLSIMDNLGDGMDFYKPIEMVIKRIYVDSVDIWFTFKSAWHQRTDLYETAQR